MLQGHGILEVGVVPGRKRHEQNRLRDVEKQTPSKGKGNLIFLEQGSRPVLVAGQSMFLDRVEPSARGIQRALGHHVTHDATGKKVTQQAGEQVRVTRFDQVGKGFRG